MISVEGRSTAPASRSLWEKVFALRQELAWVAVGQAAAAIGGIVGVRLMTHWLPPVAYGRLALGLTITTLLQQTVLSPFTSSALRFFSAAREVKESPAFLIALGRILRVLVAITAAFSIAGAVAVWLAHQSAWVPVIAWCGVFALFVNFSQTLDGMQNAARQRVIVAWHDGAGVWLRFLVGTLAVVAFGPSETNAIAGYAIAAVLVCLSQYFFFRRVLAVGDERVPQEEPIMRWKRAIVEYSWPMAAWGPFVWVQSASERWALQIFGDATQVAHYAVLYQLGYYPITMLGGFVMQLVSPIIYGRAGDGHDAAKIARVHRLSIRIAILVLSATGVCALAAHAAAPLIFSWIVPSAYYPSAPLLPGLVLSGGVFWAGQFASLSLVSGRKTNHLILPKISTAVLAVLFNGVGAAMFGLKGVVWAGVLFATVHSTWLFVLSCHRANSA